MLSMALPQMTTYFGRPRRIPAPQCHDAVCRWLSKFSLALLLAVGFLARLAPRCSWRFSLSSFAALIAHTNFADGNQLNHFLKCLGVIGGCLA